MKRIPKAKIVRLAESMHEARSIADVCAVFEVTAEVKVVLRNLGREGFSVAAFRSGKPFFAPTYHSLRAGLVTAAVRAGKPFSAIKKQTGHSSIEMVDRYARLEQVFEDHASEGVGL